MKNYNEKSWSSSKELTSQNTSQSTSQNIFWTWIFDFFHRKLKSDFFLLTIFTWSFTFYQGFQYEKKFYKDLSRILKVGVAKKVYHIRRYKNPRKILQKSVVISKSLAKGVWCLTDSWNFYWNIHSLEGFLIKMNEWALFVFPWICKSSPALFLCLHIASWIYCI